MVAITAAAVPSCASSYSNGAHWDLSPALATEQDRIDFILALNRIFPSLLTDSVTYDTNWDQLLKKQQAIVNALKMNEEYLRLAAERQDLETIEVLDPE